VNCFAIVFRTSSETPPKTVALTCLLVLLLCVATRRYSRTKFEMQVAVGRSLISRAGATHGAESLCLMMQDMRHRSLRPVVERIAAFWLAVVRGDSTSQRLLIERNKSCPTQSSFCLDHHGSTALQKRGDIRSAISMSLDLFFRVVIRLVSSGLHSNDFPILKVRVKNKLRILVLASLSLGHL